MGTSDVVPGVSGGTIALVLGIYEDFIAALGSINLQWIKHLAFWLGSGLKRHHLENAIEAWKSIHWGFLLPLISGMLVAISVASKFVPILIEEYPVQMRALFFGLVLASIVVTARSATHVSLKHLAMGATFCVGTFWLLGVKGEPPSAVFSETTKDSITLGEFNRLHPSLDTPVQAWCPRIGANDNVAMRLSVQIVAPAEANRLNEICSDLVSAGSNAKAVNEIIRQHGLDTVATNPFFNLELPPGTEVKFKRPGLLFTFVSGAIAISAMVLPGISGSFLLLILGVYEFILMCLRASIAFFTGTSSSFHPVFFTLSFAAGVGAGVLGFSRVLKKLFADFRQATIVSLVGIMLGSLRVIWPFQLSTLDGSSASNYLPTMADPVFGAIAFCAIGYVVVVGLANLSDRIDAKLRTESSNAG